MTASYSLPGNVNAALADTNAAATVTPNNEMAVQRLENALRNGIINYNDLADAGIVRPKQRLAEVAVAEDTASAAQAETAMRPMKVQSRINDQALIDSNRSRNIAENAASMSTLPGEVTRKLREQNALLSVPPETEVEIARLAAGAKKAELEQKIADPLGGRQAVATRLATQGIFLPPNATDDQIRAALDESITREETFKIKLAALKSRADAAAAFEDPEKRFKAIQSLREELLNYPEIRSLANVRGFRDAIHASTARANLDKSNEDPVGLFDTAAVYSFIKLLDPSSSVREGENTIIASSQSPVAAFANLWNRMVSGNRFTPELRKQLDEASDILYKNYAKAALPQLKLTERVAKAAGFSVDQVLNESLQASLKELSSGTTGAAPAAQAATPAAQALGPGVRRYPNGGNPVYGKLSPDGKSVIVTDAAGNPVE